jgi:hypothetical protein
VGLVGQVGAEHIAHVEDLRAQPAGILHGGLDGFHAQLAQGGIPVFTDRELADSGNDNVSHMDTPYFIVILPRMRAYVA